MENNIQKQSISFENEEEKTLFIRKETIRGIGGKDYKLLSITQKVLMSKNNKPYTTYTLQLEDEYNKYEIDRLMREQLKWTKRANPKMIHLTVENDGKYLNWVVTPLD